LARDPIPNTDPPPQSQPQAPLEQQPVVQLTPQPRQKRKYTKRFRVPPDQVRRSARVLERAQGPPQENKM
jgi:hypothetical protein